MPSWDITALVPGDSPGPLEFLTCVSGWECARGLDKEPISSAKAQLCHLCAKLMSWQSLPPRPVGDRTGTKLSGPAALELPLAPASPSGLLSLLASELTILVLVST